MAVNGPSTDPSAPDLLEVTQVDGFTPVDLYQRRERIHTRLVGGFFQKLRFFTGWPLLAGYFILPWINWGERPAVLFDLGTRQFHILGLTFWPQDFMLLAWLLIIAAFGLFTVTTLVGRLWCGYTCPQTVWTAIFIWVEQFTEGTRTQRIRLDAAPWSLAKLRKRVSKHAMWLAFAFLTGLTFVGYFLPIRDLSVALLTLEAAPAAMFWTGLFTLATYGNAGFMREQVCKYMCPYARFQSAMIDKNTLVVAYDAARGEPRGSRKRGQKPAALGDCLDCQLCVQVCPTGIDIRKGLQYECIGCAHCIDACNEMMSKVGYASDLISYTTENRQAGRPSPLLRPNLIGYACLLSVMIGAFSWALWNRPLLAIDVIRERGALYHTDADGNIRNDFTVQLMNKTQHAQAVDISVTNETASYAITPSTTFMLQPGEIQSQPISLTWRGTSQVNEIGAKSQSLTIRLCTNDRKHCSQEVTRFIAPSSTSP